MGSCILFKNIKHWGSIAQYMGELNIIITKKEQNFNPESGPWQRNFVDACFLQFHMFPAVWSYTTTIGLLDPKHPGPSESGVYSDVIQEAQSNDLLHTARLLMRLDAPLHDNNARGTKYAVYYASVVTHTVFENKKMAALTLFWNWKGSVASLASLFPARVLHLNLHNINGLLPVKYPDRNKSGRGNGTYNLLHTWPIPLTIRPPAPKDTLRYN